MTVITIVLDIAGLPDTHTLLDVNSHCTLSPFISPLVVNVCVVIPVSTPETIHLYPGEPPPLTGVAVNVAV